MYVEDWFRGKAVHPGHLKASRLVITMPLLTMSAASSGGVISSKFFTPSIMASMGSAKPFETPFRSDGDILGQASQEVAPLTSIELKRVLRVTRRFLP